MIGRPLQSKRTVLLWAVGPIRARVSLADVVDDFSKDGWRAANPKAPARFGTSATMVLMRNRCTFRSCLPLENVVWAKYGSITISRTFTSRHCAVVHLRTGRDD